MKPSHRHISSAAALAWLHVVCIVACNAKDGGRDSGIVAAAGITGGQGGAGGDLGPVAGISAPPQGGSPAMGTAGAPPGPADINCTPCSADLRTTLQCDGVVKEDCPANMACAPKDSNGGTCIADACEAARLAKSTYGCDYWSLRLDVIQDGRDFCYAVFVANTWSEPVKIKVQRAGRTFDTASFARIASGQGASLSYQPYDGATGLPPGEVAILFISHSAGSINPCPAGITPALVDEPWVQGTGLGDALQITTDQPVVAYSIFPYGGGSSALTSATLLLPTSAWGEHYVVATPGVIESVPPVGGAFDGTFSIVAAEDGTEVVLNPAFAIVGGVGVPATLAKQSVKYSLARGQYLQITQQEDLSGSPFESNKPVALFGGATCMNVPLDVGACDAAHQQIPPVNALGSEYVAVRYRGRTMMPNESVPYRMVGLVNGTKLSYEPAAPAGAPKTLALGQVAQLDTAEAFVVRSQDKEHPFYLSSYMTGGQPLDGEGDPEWVNVVPGDQYLSAYVFFTDPTYPETNLVVVRPKGSDDKFHDVTLDCAGVLTGWQPLGAKYEYTRVDLVTGNFSNVGACSNGRHTLRSDAPVGLTVWGWGSSATDVGATFSEYVSYAYPAGMSVRSINKVKIEIPEPE